MVHQGRGQGPGEEDGPSPDASSGQARVGQGSGGRQAFAGSLGAWAAMADSVTVLTRGSGSSLSHGSGFLGAHKTRSAPRSSWPAACPRQGLQPQAGPWNNRFSIFRLWQT